MSQYAKVVIIGLDGADWRLLDPWIQNGHLATLSKLMCEGTTGKLRSTIRPESSVAWSSFSSGVNPGKHGVYGFAERAASGYGYRLGNARSVRVRRFWDVLGDRGLKVGLLNIPFTYPPSPVNGFMITGMLTPGPDVAFTYPAELQRWLLERFESYIFDTGESARDMGELVAQVRAHTQQLRETALLLLQEQSWDCFTVVFPGPDRLQHFLWADREPYHPLHNPHSRRTLDDALLEHYRALDDAVAAILNCLPPDTLVLLMSDHGFNGCSRRFYVNRWLCDRGLLTLKNSGGWHSEVAALLARLGSVRWLRRLKRAVLPKQWSSVNLHSIMFAQSIDWSHTKVFFGLDGGLTVNLWGREVEGIVQPGHEFDALRQALRQELLAVKDPTTGLSVLADVFFREELYHGRFLDRAPDLVLEPQRERTNPAHNYVLDGSLEGHETGILGSSAPYTANHALDGVLMAWGPGVASGAQIEDAHIVDLAPTVLAALGVEVPDYMDGRILSELFLPGQAPVLRQAQDGILQRTSGVEADLPEEPVNPFSVKDELTVEARLRRLGYLD